MHSATTTGVSFGEGGGGNPHPQNAENFVLFVNQSSVYKSFNSTNCQKIITIDEIILYNNSSRFSSQIGLAICAYASEL